MNEPAPALVQSPLEATLNVAPIASALRTSDSRRGDLSRCSLRAQTEAFGVARVGLRTSTLPIAGLAPMTTVDFPGHLAMAVFTQGCPWHCPYCHNSALRTFHAAPAYTWNHVRNLLAQRKGFLDGVVFSGGEPLCHSGLHAAIREAREEGYAIGLHTAGMFPDRLANLLPDLDWVGLDIKAPLDERYDRITGALNSAVPARASLKLLLVSGIAFQLRTTVAKNLLSESDLSDLRGQLAALGAPAPVLQTARPVAA
jgi:pyruvate formate lyase activating enzyme